MAALWFSPRSFICGAGVVAGLVAVTALMNPAGQKELLKSPQKRQKLNLPLRTAKPDVQILTRIIQPRSIFRISNFNHKSNG